MRVYEALATALKESGVDTVFGLCGSETVKLGYVLDSLGVRFYGTRHESQAVAMADGYARVSRRLGVALISRGPGFTNAISAMVVASRAHSPVLVIAGDTAVGATTPAKAISRLAEPKYIDQEAICRAAGIPSAKLLDAESAVEDLRAIVTRARSGFTISLNIPTDILEATAGDAGSRIELAPIEPVPSMDPASITTVADLLESGWAAQKPMILAGRGAFLADARDELTTLGDLTGAILTTSLLARSFFEGQPYNIGVCGSLTTDLAREFIAQADTVLAFGASLNGRTTLDGSLIKKARLIQVDSDYSAFGRFTAEPDLAIHADVKSTAAALVAELQRRGHSAQGFRTPEVAEQIRDYRLESSFTDASTETSIDPRTLMARLDTLLPRERTLVVEGGEHLHFSCKYLGVSPPPAFLFPMETYAIGFGVGSAVGAAVGQPDRMTVLEIGDAGLMMTLGDLETAARYRIPLLVVISNNDGLGSEMHHLRNAGLSDEFAHFSTPSFAAVAGALGAEGYTIRTTADLNALGERLQEPLDGPLLLDCHVLFGVSH
jgi:thiamine pyrophosphate-dependent acetolactate synthase large subunit-like protein